MNKLVSKNPIQRFKQGKTDKVGKGAYKVGNNWYKIGGNGKPAVFEESPLGSNIGKLSAKKVSTLKPSSKQNTKSFAKPKVIIDSHFMKGYEDIQPEIGGPENIKAMQQKIQSFYAPGTYKDDGIWGKNTQDAYEKYLQSLTPVKQEIKPQSWFAQVTPQQNNFGYRTDNTYEGNDFSDKLKGLGIGSNADLINFMYKTGGENYDWKGNNWAKQFRSDINQALGGDYSDTNIRKVFNTQGNWRKGFLGGGDISDFQRILQTNAGVWNGIYDKQKEEYQRNIPVQTFLNNYFAIQPWKMNRNFDLSSSNVFRAKQGGQLPSRNPVKRFKSIGNFR